MLILEIRLLTGRYAAATVRDRSVAEWPPHPARVYSALTAALHEAPEPDANEVRALEWLAEAGAPEILASRADKRQLGNVYVPTNDPKALPDIDLHIERLAEAEAVLAGTEGKARSKAEKALEKARAKLLERSVSSAEADGKGAPANAADLLNRRLKPQPRPFPAAIPEDDVLHLMWDTAPDPDLVEALDRVAARVARLGHSSSLASMRVVTEPVEAGDRQHWIPSDDGPEFLRVAQSGQLARLREEYERHRQVESRLLPADDIAYRDASNASEQAHLASGVFAERADEWIVFEVVAPSADERRTLLDLSMAQQVARAMRGTLFRHIDPKRQPEELTGHRPDGAPASVPHLAYVPLANVGHEHSTGTILGLALIPPQDFGVRARDLLLEAIHGAEIEAAGNAARPTGTVSGPPALRLTFGKRGVLHLRRLREASIRTTLLPTRWTAPSRRWYTASAVALGRNPGNLNARDPERAAKAVKAAEATIATACVNVGLPPPAAVWAHRRSLLNGAPTARQFMPFPAEGSGPRRVCVHAEILFDQPVRGPVILGAGRYFGLGLCAPVRKAP
ncbi:MAG: type I-G CRISPR-associated protein Csb2 [Gemmatimonadaceae bacterium]